MKKSSDFSRGLLFGLLVNCIFSIGASEDCPLQDLRESLTSEQKHAFVMGLTDEEIENILVQHEESYETRLSQINQAQSFRL